MGAVCCAGRKKAAVAPHRKRKKKHLRNDEHECSLDILDTAGQEEFGALRDLYSRDANGFLIVFSITDEASYKEVENIYEKLRKTRDEQKVPAVLCGNKCDLKEKRTVSTEQGHQMASRLGIPYFETSAKENTNIEMVYEHLVSQEIPIPSSSVKIVMCGSGGVGKSSITTRYISGCFGEEYDPTIEDSFRKTIIVRHKHPWLNEDKKLCLKASGLFDIDDDYSEEEIGIGETRAAITSPTSTEAEDGPAAAAVQSPGG